MSDCKVPQVAASGTVMRTFVREPARSPQDVVPCDRLQKKPYPKARLEREDEPLCKQKFFSHHDKRFSALYPLDGPVAQQ